MFQEKPEGYFDAIPDGYHDACNGWDYCDKNNPVTETSRC